MLVDEVELKSIEEAILELEAFEICADVLIALILRNTEADMITLAVFVAAAMVGVISFSRSAVRRATTQEAGSAEWASNPFVRILGVVAKSFHPSPRRVVSKDFHAPIIIFPDVDFAAICPIERLDGNDAIEVHRFDRLVLSPFFATIARVFGLYDIPLKLLNREQFPASLANRYGVFFVATIPAVERARPKAHCVEASYGFFVIGTVGAELEHLLKEPNSIGIGFADDLVLAAHLDRFVFQAIRCTPYSVPLLHQPDFSSDKAGQDRSCFFLALMCSKHLRRRARRVLTPLVFKTTEVGQGISIGLNDAIRILYLHA